MVLEDGICHLDTSSPEQCHLTAAMNKLNCVGQMKYFAYFDYFKIITKFAVFGDFYVILIMQSRS